MQENLPYNHSGSFSDVEIVRIRPLVEIADRQNYGLKAKRNLTFKERNF